MQRTETYKSLGVQVKFQVPANPFAPGSDEYKIFEAGIDNIVYRSGSGLPLFRELFAEAVEKACGYSAETRIATNAKGEERKDAEGNAIRVFVDDEAARVEKALAHAGRSIESCQDIADAVSAQLKFDPSTKERVSNASPKTPPKAVFEQVDALIAAGQASAVAASLATILGHEVAEDRDSLAKAVHEDQLNEMRRIKNKFAIAK